MSCHEHMSFRANALKICLRRSTHLRDDELALAIKLESSVAEVLKGKRLLLWEEMLQAINYPDLAVFDEFCAGSMLTGQTERTGLWPAKVTPATLTEGELRNQARLQRAALSCGRFSLTMG